MSKINSYRVIGLMSGSSLDGLDICYVRFRHSDSGFEYELIKADCVEYDAVFRSRLRNIAKGTAFELAQFHTELGRYFGKLTRTFMDKYGIESVDFIASHGQTIFHQPALGFTSQIGCGAQIAAQTQCKTICDLRAADLAYGGQGAPIVPVAEKYLFPEYRAFLNIGGIANISFHRADGTVLAYDIGAANTLLNHFARQQGKEYDEDGNLARSGRVDYVLLKELNGLAFCKQAAPKSLGTEHIFRDWLPLFDKYNLSMEDKLATSTEHIAMMIANEMNSKFKIGNSKLLVTGGGALNTFLIERIQQHSPVVITVPDTVTVQYKEALAMAFIGLLRWLEKPNVLGSVTGASKNSMGGAIYIP